MNKNTYIEIDLNAIERNVKKIIETYPEYFYKVAVVKSDCYGHKGNEVVEAILKAGANFLAVSFLEEALKIRERWKEIPIVLLVPPPFNEIEDCIKNNISITVPDFEYLETLKGLPIKVHLRVDVGNDFYNGPKTGDELKKYVDFIDQNNLFLEGLYMHSYCAEDVFITEEGFKRFESMIQEIDIKNIPMLSVPNSQALTNYKKINSANAFRMGNVMYGIENESLHLEDTFHLYSSVLSVKELKEKEAIGYNNCYVAEKPSFIAILPIGYGHGFTKVNIGNQVYIKEKPYTIVAVTMDITLVEVDSSVQKGDLCVLIKENRHLDQIALHNKSIAEEILCCLNTRIPRIYKKD